MTEQMTIAAASELLGVDPKTLRRWTGEGLIQEQRQFHWSRPSYERKHVERLAHRFGISLDRNRNLPAHYTPPSLAAAIGHGMTATRIRTMIVKGEIRLLTLPENPHRQSLQIDQAEGLRVIRLLTKHAAKAG
jgi:DNA-binding transcriptional MerR regulator